LDCFLIEIFSANITKRIVWGYFFYGIQKLFVFLHHLTNGRSRMYIIIYFL